jgi:hypothetical protein
MPPLLRDLGLDPGSLQSRHDGSALEFQPRDADAFTAFLAGLLTHLLGSDFALAFPARPILCSVHHHKQLWWSTTDPELFAAIDGTVPADEAPRKRGG